MGSSRSKASRKGSAITGHHGGRFGPESSVIALPQEVQLSAGDSMINLEVLKMRERLDMLLIVDYLIYSLE